MIEEAIRQADSDWRFLTFEVSAEALADAIRGIRALGFKGAKIIDPHCEAVLEYVDEATRRAELAGWANCLTRQEDRLVADNTLGMALSELVGEFTGKRVTILGSGPTARALATAAALGGALHITMCDLSIEHCETIAALIKEETSATTSTQARTAEPLLVEPGTGVLINASAADSNDSELVVDEESLDGDLIVCELAFDSPATHLGRLAENRGCKFIDGLSLLVEQTALALKIWSGIEADREAMREAAEEYLVL